MNGGSQRGHCMRDAVPSPHIRRRIWRSWPLSSTTWTMALRSCWSVCSASSRPTSPTARSALPAPSRSGLSSSWQHTRRCERLYPMTHLCSLASCAYTQLPRTEAGGSKEIGKNNKFINGLRLEHSAGINRFFYEPAIPCPQG